MKYVGLIKGSETRNDGITVRKSLLWKLTIYNVPMYALNYAGINVKNRDFLTVIPSFLLHF